MRQRYFIWLQSACYCSAIWHSLLSETIFQCWKYASIGRGNSEQHHISYKRGHWITVTIKMHLSFIEKCYRQNDGFYFDVLILKICIVMKRKFVRRWSVSSKIADLISVQVSNFCFVKPNLKFYIKIGVFFIVVSRLKI